MADQTFQSLSPGDRRDALEVAASRSGRRAHLLEKDIWVVQTLQALVEAPFGRHLTFKGGTSLAKAYRVVHRFSEDLDITYDIRSIAADLVADGDEEALPPSRSQAQRWARQIRKRLPEWVERQALPAIEDRLQRAGLSAQLRVEEDRLFIEYAALFEGSGFVKPEVFVEFGARSTGEPRQERLIECDVGTALPGVTFPTAFPFVMAAERTFWEKATAIHVFCRQQRKRGQRLSRHWHDLVRLDDAGLAEDALVNRSLAEAVARHKSMFFREKDATGSWIDYEAAVSGGLLLVPEGQARTALADDYARMVSDGMLLDDEEPFSQLMDKCAHIQARANGA